MFFNKNNYFFIIAIFFLIIFVIAPIIVYTSVSVIKIGNDTKYTFSDIGKVAKIERWIGDIVGVTGLKTRQDILYYLAISGVKKEILRKENILISKENTIKIFESRITLKGLDRKIKDYLGVEDYYRLYVEFIAINDVFKAYFDSNNHSKKEAAGFLKTACTLGFDKASEQSGISVSDITVEEDKNNKDFISELKLLQDKKDKIYQKIIDIENAYIIAKLKEVKDKSVIITAAVIKKKDLRDFLIEEAKMIDINFSIFSWFFEKDLKLKEGSIFYVSE